MKEAQARKIELVRAIELQDRDATLLTREDREQADYRGRTAAASSKGLTFERRFLAARADFAATRLTTRHKGLADLLNRSEWPAWVAIIVPLVALIAGILANEFGTDKRMDLLAVPLLGTIVWNILVYLWVLTAAVARLKARTPSMADPLTTALAWIGSVGRGDPDQGTGIERAAAAFRNRWAELTAPLNAARASRTLHLGAAFFAIGLIGGIYARALITEYRAGWESTFLGATQVRAILSLVLGPASAVSGVPIPPLPDIAAMRWTGAARGGVNAGPWIHLYMLTIAGLVVVPRLLLALLQGLRAARLAHNLPVAGREDFYVRRVLRGAGASPGRARVTPYAYRPDEETRRRLAALLQAALGDGAEVRFDEPVNYGAEDEWAATHSLDPNDDHHLLLFTLSATPEAENHGHFALLVAEKARGRGRSPLVGALIDESPYRAHFSGQAGLDERVETRLEGWRRLLAPAEVRPLGVDLSNAEGDALARRIEASLIPDAELRR